MQCAAHTTSMQMDAANKINFRTRKNHDGGPIVRRYQYWIWCSRFGHVYKNGFDSINLVAQNEAASFGQRIDLETSILSMVVWLRMLLVLKMPTKPFSSSRASTIRLRKIAKYLDKDHSSLHLDLESFCG